MDRGGLSGRGRTAARRLRARRGMTLIEVVVALGILAGVVMGMGVFAVNFAHSVRTDSMKSIAVELASDRLETVKSASKYETIESLYEATEDSISGYPGFKRQTYITHVGGGGSDLVDYLIVTVVVTSPPLLVKPVQKTTVIGSF